MEAARPEETMGRSFVLESLVRYFGRSNGNSAPAKIISMPSSMEVFTISGKLLITDMVLTPRIPLLSFLAFLISFF
jgi:hypothetical protein